MASKSPLEINFLSPSIFPVGQGEGGRKIFHTPPLRRKRKKREEGGEDASAWCVCRGEARCFFEGREGGGRSNAFTS